MTEDKKNHQSLYASNHKHGIEDDYCETSISDEENFGDAPAKGKKKIHRRGRVTKLELQTELRHKYLTILKSLYWEYFEEGQCGPEAVVVLMEAADRALDHEETPLDDWGFINTYVLSNAFLSCIGSLAKIPFFGKVFRNLLFDHFSVSYDICVNFIEGHEEASKMLVNVI